jgi:nicotinamide-nucleotide amidase
VAGPDPSDGKPPGTVHIAAASPAAATARTLALAGSREEIREQTVAESLRLLWAALTEETT